MERRAAGSSRFRQRAGKSTKVQVWRVPPGITEVPYSSKGQGSEQASERGYPGKGSGLQGFGQDEGHHKGRGMSLVEVAMQQFERSRKGQ